MNKGVRKKECKSEGGKSGEPVVRIAAGYFPSPVAVGGTGTVACGRSILPHSLSVRYASLLIIIQVCFQLSSLLLHGLDLARTQTWPGNTN